MKHKIFGSSLTSTIGQGGQVMKNRYCLTVLAIALFSLDCAPNIYPGRLFNLSDKPVTFSIVGENNFRFSIEVPSRDGVRSSLAPGNYQIQYLDSEGNTLASRKLKIPSRVPGSAGRFLRPGPDCPGIKQEEFDYWIISYSN